MKHIIEQWDGQVCDSNLWDFYFKDLNIGVLDIETTGINPDKNKFILGCIFDANAGQLHQILAESRAEEGEILKEYLKHINRMDAVVTYNGRHFDMPFVYKRYDKVLNKSANGFGEISDTYYEPYNMDLFHVVNRYSQLKKLLPNLKQKTLENYMGFWNTRCDEISGKESIELYNYYEKTGDSEAERKILLHNNDDVRQLTRLTKVVTKCDLHRAMFHLGFPVKCSGTGSNSLVLGREHVNGSAASGDRDKSHLIEVKGIKLQGNSLRISGRQLRNPVNYMAFEYGGMAAEIKFISDDKGRAGEFQIELPLLSYNGLTIIDLEQVGLSAPENLEKYPLCQEGFLVIHDGQELKYREINHFVITFIKAFFEKEVME